MMAPARFHRALKALRDLIKKKTFNELSVELREDLIDLAEMARSEVCRRNRKKPISRYMKDQWAWRIGEMLKLLIP